MSELSKKLGIKKPKPNLFGTEQKTNRQRGDKHEQDTANEINGNTQPNSGATAWQRYKGDVSSDNFLYQCKLTDKNRFTINETILAEITRQARVNHKDPVVVIKMESIQKPTPNEWCMIPMEVYKYLIGE